MPDEDGVDLSAAIAANAAGPAQASGDSSSVRQHSLPDQIAADKYLAAKRAQAAGGLGIKRFKLVPPGMS